MKRAKLISAAIFTYCILQTANCFPQGTAINSSGTKADTSAGLDVSFNNKGILIPRLSTAERNSIVSPASSLLIYNSTTKCFEFFEDNYWQSIVCSCPKPPAPTSGVHTALKTQITWDWSDVPGVSGYQWNTSDIYPGSGVNVVSNSDYTQTGLTCNTPYSLYVWTYSSCAYSLSTLLSDTTAACFSSFCGLVTFTYNGSQVTYGTVEGQNGTCWLDRNLGALAVADSMLHEDAYGDLFQWGRLDDAHQLRTNMGTTPILSTTDDPGHSDFITTTGADWRSPKNDNLWQGVSGINNPCPSGWRLPVENELSAEYSSWSEQNYVGAVNSPLKLPSGGYRYDGTGELDNIGGVGICWTSTVSGQAVRTLNYYSSGAGIYTNGRAYGFSVRCIKD